MLSAAAAAPARKSRTKRRKLSSSAPEMGYDWQISDIRMEFSHLIFCQYFPFFPSYVLCAVCRGENKK